MKQYTSARCLIVGPAWVGDMVMAQSLFKILKQRSPRKSISVLAPGWTRPILERMPEVGESIEMPVGHGQLGIASRLQLGRMLRSKKFSQAIVLPGSWKAALVPWIAKIPQRSGFVGEQRWGLLNDIRRLDKTRMPLNVQRFVALGMARDAPLPEQIPYPALKVNAAARSMTAQRFSIDPTLSLLSLCPGAEYGPAKRWPAEHFAKVARAKAEEGWQVALFGSAKEQPLCAKIDSHSGGACIDLSGRTTLGEAIDLLSLSNTVVSNDSGLMHVAAALGRKLIAIYGSSSPDFTPPLDDDCEIQRLQLPCSPCFKRECPLGHLDCLYKLLPEQVLGRIH